MFKEYLVITADDLEKHSEFQDYVIHRHAPAAVRHRAFSGVFRRYLINYTPPLNDLGYTSLHNLRVQTPVVVEHVCDDAGQFRNALHDEDYKAEIGPDEEHMLHSFLSAPPIAIEMDEETIFSDSKVGKFRIFDFLKRSPGISEQDFRTWLDEEGAYWAGHYGFRAVASRLVHNHPSEEVAVYAEHGSTGASTGRDYDAIVETWVDDPSGVARIYPEMRKRHAPYVDGGPSFSVLTHEHVLISDLPHNQGQ